MEKWLDMRNRENIADRLQNHEKEMSDKITQHQTNFVKLENDIAQLNVTISNCDKKN